MSQPERIYNYRVSRARRVVENAFGILASKFRVFEEPISLKVETVDKVVLASCALHNYLKKTHCYVPPGLADYDNENNRTFPGSWRQNRNSGLTALQPTHHRHSNLQAELIRNRYRDYFNNEGAVPWQNELVEI